MRGRGSSAARSHHRQIGAARTGLVLGSRHSPAGGYSGPKPPVGARRVGADRHQWHSGRTTRSEGPLPLLAADEHVDGSLLVQVAMHLCGGCGAAPQPSDNLPHAVPQILHFEPSLDALSLRSDVIGPMKTFSSCQHSGVARWQECDYTRPPQFKPG